MMMVMMMGIEDKSKWDEISVRSLWVVYASWDEYRHPLKSGIWDDACDGSDIKDDDRMTWSGEDEIPSKS